MFNKIKLTATTRDRWAFELYPITHAKDLPPSWWEKAKRSYEKTRCPFKSVINHFSTVRNCSGVNSILTTGFLLRAWADMSIIILPNGDAKFSISSPNGSLDVHPNEQQAGFRDDLVFLKIVTPWVLKGDPTKYIAIPPVYHGLPEGVELMPSGILSFDIQDSLNVFFAVKPKKEPYEIFVKAGEPLVHLVPLSEKKFSVKVSFDPNSSNSAHPFFFNRYARYKNALKGKK